MARPVTAAALEMRHQCEKDANQARALVTGEGSTMLPASQKFPKLAFFLPWPCLQQHLPRGSVVALLAEAGGCVTRCCERRHGLGGGLQCAHDRLPAAPGLEWSASSPPRSRRPSAPPGPQTAKGGARGAAWAEAVPAWAGSPATAGPLGMRTPQRRVRAQRPQSHRSK